MGKFYTFSGNYISRVGLAMLLMLLSFPVFSLQGPGAGWPYERKITLSTPTTMTNYQVRVTLSATTMGNPYTNVRSDGYDLRFYDNNDILCNYWVEKWDNTDTSIIWVKIPSNNCSFLNMYYGNAGAPDGQSIPTNVFDWFDGFDGTALGSMWNTEVSGGGAITVNGGNVTLSKTTATTDYAYLFPKSPGFSPASTSFYLESKFYATEYSRNRFYASDRSGNVTPGVPYRPLGFDYGYYNDASNTGEGYAWYTYMSGDVTKVYINTNYITQWAISDKNDYNWSTLSYPSYNAEDAQAAFFPKDVRYITFGVDYGNMANSSVIDWVRVRKRQPIDPVTTVGVPAQVTITGLSSLSGCKGSILTIKGYYLSGATVAGVTIGGTPVTSIISNDDNEIVVVVGNGTSGKVSVTTPMGTAVSTDDYVVNSGTIPDFFSVTGGGLNCNGGSVSLDGSQTGITYELLRDGASITPAVTLSGTGSPLDFGVQTIEGSYSVLASNGAGTCVTEMDNHAVVAIAPGIKITTGSSTVCLGDAIPLTASLASEDGVSSGISSGLTSSKTIPDNSPAGVQSGIAINFVPANTIITNVIVRFKVTHPNIEDLVINLKGPNGNVINIANHMGGTADNFGNGYDRALIDNLSSLSINMGTHPYTDQFYAPQADGGVQGATVVTNNISNVISLTDLFTGNSGAAANGYWVLSVRDDVAGNSGTLDVFEVRIDFAYTSNPLNVSWSASPDLFLDKNATIPYTSGTFASTVFAKPTATGTVDYSAIAGTNGCVATKSITVNASPDLHLSADYCTPGGGVVRITANAEPSPSPAIDKWIWNTIGATDASYSSYVDVTSPGKYFVAAKSTGVSCVSKAEISVSDNLIPNGNFEAGFTDFVTDYYFTGNPFGVNLNANWINSGFYGKDHTLGNGMGKFLILQAGAIGGVTNKVIWKRAGIPVKPSTRYYYSFWAMSLNNTATDAKLQIQINGTGTWISGTQLNTTITLPQGVNSNDNNGWKQYYGVWESGSSTTSIDLSLVNDEANPKGIGIDDIAFGTLTSFFRLKSANATLNQTICEGTPITDVVFETAGNGAMPTISSGSLPSGVVAYWDGRNFRLSGSPNTAGTYIFTVEAEDCNPAPAFTQSVTINVTAPSNAGTLALGNPMIADCYGSSGTISLTGSLGTLQWQVSNDQVSWTNVGNGNYTNLNNTSYYRVIAQNTAACPKDTSSIVKLAVKNLWTGKSNTLWETGSNWSDNNYPLTSGCDVVIPQLPTARYPLLNSDTVSVGNIEIKPNANVTVMGTALFDIAGNLTSTAGMDATDGTLKFSGTTAQTISGGMFVDTTVKKLIVNNNTGLNVAKSAGENALAITGKIEFATGSAKLYSNGNTVLKSTKSHTANLGQVMNSNQVNGEFTVERYINIGTGTGEHGKAWHVIAPNTSGQTIKQSWMENGDNSVNNYGINLTGAAGGGWDGVSPAPAIKYYVPNSGQGAWAGAANSGVLLDSKNAWMVFVRGDRSVTGQWDAPKPTTLRSKGTIKTGTQTIPVPAIVNGFYLIGNPYPSAVDVRLITGLGTTLTYYVWNPNQGGAYGLGAYQTFAYDGADYISPSGDTIANYIQSGQGFFVQTFASPGTIEFHESDKVDGSDNTIFFRGNGEGSRQVGTLRSNVLSGDGTILDGTLQFFSDDYSNEVDMADGRKMMNTGLNLSVKAKGQLLVVERRQHLNLEDTIFYKLTGIGNGKYSFALKTSGLSTTGLEGWLEDAFTGQRHPVNMDGITSVAFDVTSAAASKAANRFRMVFTSAFGPMPVTFVKVDAAKEGSEVRVKWDVANEINLQKYVVMRSADGNKFTDIVSVNAEGKTSYNALDRQPVSGYNYYRIRSVDKDGTEAYSSIVKVWMGAGEAKISVFPNPIVNGVVNLKLENMATGKYNVKLLNPIGQVILTREIDHSGGNYTERIPWDYKMAHGTYQLEVKQPDGMQKVIRILY